MRKYYILAGLFGSIILSTIAQAEPASEQKSPQNTQQNNQNESPARTKGGFYIGGGINYSWTDYDLDTSQNTSLTDNMNVIQSESYSNSEAITGDGVGGQLFAGYEFYINSTLSIGLEAQVSAADTDKYTNQSVTIIDQGGTELTSAQTKAKLEQDWAMGLSILPTYHFADYAIDLFGVAGWQLGRFNVSGTPGGISSLNQQILAEYNSVQMASVNESKTLNGIMLGFGVKKNFTESLGMRLEYNWTRFSSFNASGSSSTSYSIGGGLPNVEYTNSTDVSVRPTTQQVKLSLVYDIP